MKIVQLYSGQNLKTGDYIYRIQKPAQGLSNLGVTILNVDLLALPSPQVLEQVPFLILHHLADPDILSIVNLRKKRGLPTFYELADNFYDSQRIKYHSKVRYDYNVIIEEFVRRCDAIQTTNPQLSQIFQNLNANIFVFPNLVQIISKKFPAKKSSKSENVVIGWGGSLRHYEDMAYFAPVICEILQKYEHVKFAIMAAEKFLGLFTRVPRKQIIYRQPGSLQEYIEFLKILDIGLAPLLPTDFNACRSDVKFLEYASRGVVPVCSKFGPYLNVGDENQSIVYFENAKEMKEKLEILIKQPKLRNKIAQSAWHWVQKKRLANDPKWQERLTIYRRFYRAKPWNESSFKKVLNFQVAELINCVLKSRNLTRSQALLKEAVKQYPDNYQVRYFYGWLLFNAGKHEEGIIQLSRALEIYPESIRVRELLARIFILLNKKSEAVKIINESLSKDKNLSTLLYLKAFLFQLENKHKKALSILKKCLKRSPKYLEARKSYYFSLKQIKTQTE